MNPKTSLAIEPESRAALQTHPVDLADLSQWSSWPARLLGLEPMPACQRTIEKIDREYDKDKYARCLKYARSVARAKLSPERVRAFEQDADSRPICAARGNELIAMPGQMAVRHYEEILVKAMRGAIREAAVIVELGCGYGYHLWTLSRQFPGKQFIGGDYSENAVRLAAFLFHAHPNIRVSRLNLYSRQYELLEELGDAGPLLIYTVHAMDQLRTTTPVLNALSRYRNRICSVFWFEPANELHDGSLLGLLRRRYAEVNDYNRDLVSRLRERNDIAIVQLQEHVFGANPLNPISVIQWKFRNT
jgi:SAM-dependent methyltransferase